MVKRTSDQQSQDRNVLDRQRHREWVGTTPAGDPAYIIWFCSEPEDAPAYKVPLFLSNGNGQWVVWVDTVQEADRYFDCFMAGHAHRVPLANHWPHGHELPPHTPTEEEEEPHVKIPMSEETAERITANYRALNRNMKKLGLKVTDIPEDLLESYLYVHQMGLLAWARLRQIKQEKKDNETG